MPQLELNDFAPQLVWLAVTFIALYIFMARVTLPRISTILEERQDRISRDIDKAELLKEETEKAIADYEQALQEARARAHTIALETRDKLAEDIARERTYVDKIVAEKTSKAEARIAASKSEALTRIDEVATDTAEAIVRKLIGVSVPKTEIETAVGSVLSETS